MSMPPPPPPSPPPPYGGGNPYGGIPSYGAGAPGAYAQENAFGAPRRYAGFGSRLGAKIIDGLVTGLISLPFSIGGFVALDKALDDCVSLKVGDRTELFCGEEGIDKPFMALAISLFVIGVVIGIAMLIRWIGTQGQTPGMKVTNIKIVDIHSGEIIGVKRSTGRYFASIISGAVCALGYLWMLWDKDKQTWHDKMASTVSVTV